MRNPGFGLVVVTATVALAAAGCGGSSGSPTTSSVSGGQQSASTTVSTRKVSGLGTILVDSSGHTLYAFAPDKHQQVTCTGSCAAVWPPLKLKAGGAPAAGGAARASLLGSDKDPSGGSVVTYGNWPLYTYAADTKPGQVNGEGVNLNGGLWYVLSPSGALIKTKPKSSSSYSGSGY